MQSNDVTLPIIFMAVLSVVHTLPSPGSESLVAVCRGDGTYPVTKLTDVFGRVTFINQNNEKIEIPRWCDLEEDLDGNNALVSRTLIADRSGV